jgi:hypothetical protein
VTPARQRARIVELLGETLLASPWLARLGRISFLGTLDQHPRSRRASNRLEHSLGVASLAADAAADLELPLARAQLFVAACLLHDIGHYPLSHAAEPAFARLLGAGHHEVGRWIVLGTGPIPRIRSLAPTLEQLGLDPALVWALVDRSPELESELTPLAALLEAPINLDTLEGIHRVARDFRLRSRKLPARIFTWIANERGPELGIASEAVPAIDRFWQLKDQVYDRIINLPSNILAEARLCDLVASKLDREVIDALDVFDDGALRRKLGAEALERALIDGSEDRDYELWASERYGEMVGASSSVERRPLLVRTRKRYFVDPAIEPGREGLTLADWSRRYRHERTRGWLVSRRQDQLALPLMGSSAPIELELDSEAPEI